LRRGLFCVCAKKPINAKKDAAAHEHFASDNGLREGRGRMQQPPATTSASHASREAVFARIVQQHGRFLYRVAFSLLRHPQDAEDAVQDALLKLYRGESWRAMQDERAFLARVVWRAALDRHASRPIGVEQDGAELRVVDARPTPARAAEENDERALLQQLIEALPAELRQPLLLSAMEEMNSREIGEIMGLPEGTVRTRLMRARAQLKEQFQVLEAAGREVAAGERRS
jgi:RNA polymerase sigma-70 factor (ECF subfamily)